MYTLNVTETIFTTKINGQEVIVDYSKMHPSWIEAHLRKAAQRFLNDQFSGLEPSDKLTEVRNALVMIHSGEEMPEKARRASGMSKSSDPVLDLALKNAKLALTAMFKAATKLAKIADMVAASPKVAAYFNSKADNHVWNDGAVADWMKAQAESGKRDFMQEARDTLETADEEELDF